MLPVTIDLIEYFGVSKVIPSDSTSFKQFNINEEFTLDDYSPDIEEVIKVCSAVSIERTKVVKTPSGCSLEGVKLTGYKLFVYGTINHKIQYTSDDNTSIVYTTNFSSPFISQIILPENFSRSICITTSVFIDDIYVKKLSSRHIYNNISLIVTLEL